MNRNITNYQLAAHECILTVFSSSKVLLTFQEKNYRNIEFGKNFCKNKHVCLLLLFICWKTRLLFWRKKPHQGHDPIHAVRAVAGLGNTYLQIPPSLVSEKGMCAINPVGLHQQHYIKQHIQFARLWTDMLSIYEDSFFYCLKRNNTNSVCN